jgi:CBS domain-containing protein
MPAATTNVISCPYCGADVIRGSDNCDSCGESLAGILLPDTALNITDSHFATPISAIRFSKPTTVSSDATLRQALDALTSDPSGAVLVVDGEGIAGIFTDRDVLQKVAAGAASLDSPVREFMTVDPVVLRDDDPMATALHKMGTGGFRHVPLTRDHELVGVVTGRDILGWMLTRYFDE